jgi:two-component system nitrate/nitrite response regulator NarL
MNTPDDEPQISPIRVLVVDDHTLFRRGLTALLACDARLAVVGDAADAGQALRRAHEHAPDVILLDNHLPGVNGIDALPALREAAPGARILMLTVSEDADDLAGALRAGAAGYLLKTMEGDALIEAIVRAHDGDSVVAPQMMNKLIAAYRDTRDTRDTQRQASSATADAVPAATSVPAGPSAPASDAQAAIASLSPRETDVLRGIVRGASNKEIARTHGIAETTVKIHVQHVLRKLNVSSRVHAAVIASENGVN